MTATFGRLLQIAGMAVLPVGLYIGVARNDMRTELTFLIVGGILFLLGLMLSRSPK